MSVSISGKLKRVSARALLIDLENGEDAQWLPFSQIDDCDADTFSSDDIGQTVELEISDWIARQKNIRPVNLERYEAVANLQDWCYPAQTAFSVMDGSTVLCRCEDRRTAVMIAAALNLTQGKV